jgi:Second Messenger Oligonucleotide or Dinucleotide Synthetase domain
MSLESAFDTLQQNVNVPAEHDKRARERRDVFKRAFSAASRADVARVFASGSLARGSQIDPIHDVDMVVVFDAAEHPGWGLTGSSAKDALEEVREQVHKLLHHENGTVSQAVRRVDVKNHSLKCFLDDPEIENAFTVDLVPAVQHGDHLLIPEAAAAGWVHSDPEYLIEAVAARHAEWRRFVPLVRVLKRWNCDHGRHMKSLVVEVLALQHLREAERPQALHAFFTAARARIYEPVVDPAGHCGVIQPDLDCDAAYNALDEAERWAYKAAIALERDEPERAQCCWQQLFGEILPAPAGGCPAEENGTGIGLLIGTGVAAVAPRKIIDAPQGRR